MILLTMLMLVVTTNAFVEEYKYNSNFSLNSNSYNMTEPEERLQLNESISININEEPREGDVIVFKNGKWALDSPPDLAYVSTMANPELPYSYYSGNGQIVYFGYNTIMVTDEIYYNNHYFHITKPGTYELEAAFPNMLTNTDINFRWYAMIATTMVRDIDSSRLANSWWYFKPIGSAGSSTEQRNRYSTRQSTSLGLARATVAVEREARFVVKAFGYGKVGYKPCQYLRKCNPVHGMSPWAVIRQLSKKFYVDKEMDVIQEFTDNLTKVHGVATKLVMNPVSSGTDVIRVP